MGFSDTAQPDTVYVDGWQQQCRYKYYLIDNEWPIRVTVVQDGGEIFSDAPNYKTRQIEQNNNFLAMMLDGNNHDYKEIDKEDFYRRCDAYMAHWTPERIAEHEGQIKANREEFEQHRDELEKKARAVEEILGIREK